jgi:DNA repair protein RadD
VGAVFELRPYQVSLVSRVRESFASGVKRVLMQAPCGSGKTCIFAHIADRVAKRGRRVLIVVHRQELTRQTVEKLSTYGIVPDLITAGTREIASGHVAVASVQSLVRRLHQYDDCWDLIIIDEGHHSVAATWKKVLDHFPRAYRLAVTATPSRHDGRGLAECFDALIVGPPVRELIDGGYLADFVCYSHPGAPDLRGLRVRAGDYAQDELADAMSRPQLMGGVAEHYAKHLAGRPAIAFGVTIRHAELLAETLRDAGWRAVSVDGTMDDDERARRINGLSNGEVQILTSCSLVDEGLDVPSTGGVILCRPTKSLAVHIQQVGRALRPKDDGSKAVVLDHANNVATFGLPDTVQHWDLNAPKRKPAENAGVRICRACFAANPPRARVCEACGTPFPLATPKPPPRTRSGDLVEIREWAHVAPGKAGVAAAVAQCRSWRELQALGKHLGYAKGWAYHAARERGWRPVVNGMGYTVGFVPPRPGYGSG